MGLIFQTTELTWVTIATHLYIKFTKHQKTTATTTTTKYAYTHQCTYSCIKSFPSGDPPMIKISFLKNNNKKNVKNTHFKRSLIWISQITYMLLRSLEVKLNSIKFIRNYTDRSPKVYIACTKAYKDFNELRGDLLQCFLEFFSLPLKLSNLCHQILKNANLLYIISVPQQQIGSQPHKSILLKKMGLNHNHLNSH